MAKTQTKAQVMNTQIKGMVALVTNADYALGTVIIENLLARGIWVFAVHSGLSEVDEELESLRNFGHLVSFVGWSKILTTKSSRTRKLLSASIFSILYPM